MYFTDICVGWPGRVHDARVLSNSKLYQKAECFGTSFPNGQPVNTNGVMVSVLIIGDPAYPLLPWLMKPYSQTGALNKQNFSFKLSITKIVVERAFGLLKGRFRILHKQQDTSLHNICHVTACCILHNYCIAHDDEADDDWLIDCEDGNDNDDDDEDDNDGHNLQGNSDADSTRESLLEYVQ